MIFSAVFVAPGGFERRFSAFSEPDDSIDNFGGFYKHPLLREKGVQ
jgi:hypothetical protein